MSARTITTRRMATPVRRDLRIPIRQRPGARFPSRMRSSAAMSAGEGYALVDAGEGRRLERFGDRLVDRPAPGAVEARRDERAWAAADMRYDRIRGWSGDSSRLAPWSVALDGLTLELRPTEAGQVGVFPEHAAMWPWLDRRIRERRGGHVLNLFAYTGATTLALA